MLFGSAKPSQRSFDFARRAAPLPGGWHVGEEAIMGTAVRVELWSDQRDTGVGAVAAVMREMHRIDRTMSPHKPDSELSRINRDAAAGPVPLSDEMFRLLERAAHFSELSGGAFDITYASVGQLYDYRLGVQPSEEALAAARAAVGWRKLELDARKRTVRFTQAGMRIDLGGFAKGWAVDRGADILRSLGIRHAMVTAGGDTRLLGDRLGKPWIVGIRDPRKDGAVVTRVPVVDEAVSTSGDYERYFEADGVRHHHILEPGTGRSPSAVRSVTIIGPTATHTDGLTKPVFILGVERGLEYLQRVGGVDAVIVDAAGQVYFSPGLEPGA